MKITVLGASGRIGTLAVREALARGSHVTAVVRSPERLHVASHPQLDVAVFELDDPSLGSAVEGRDAIVLALGARDRRPTTVNADGARAVIAAAGTARFVAVSAIGLTTEGDDPFTRLVVKPILGAVLRNGFDDLRVMESVIRASAMKWTIVRPPRLTDGPATGRVRFSKHGAVRGGFVISRADVATFLLDAAEDTALIGETVGIARG
ncbi:NAD(P)H-binding protein [Amycolatopsis carbonis]|uniref:NAD(P)H-binding protein n=1 Tax=Amycolatopsis carbonis TaxID=715471 RepID=A0A9Y2MX48_9PSEU|nr:NAD(P)H-binding protein [Amycolatopsis sp. 2-15]WIX80363.1 NAD(P)H-binding protein [Amycolatopsis sp. 2-15]